MPMAFLVLSRVILSYEFSHRSSTGPNRGTRLDN
jgi:hypothetical protein